MGPIRGQTRPLPVTAEIAPEVQRIDAKLNASIHNRFDIEVINAETGEVRQRAQAENIILNSRWSNLNNGGWFGAVHYGSGSGTPAASDTALFTFAGAKSASNVEIKTDTSNLIYSVKKKATLLETEAIGTNITEIGIGSGTDSSSLQTHAMLRDMNGNTISIVKTSTDIINIYATVFVHYSGIAALLGTDTSGYIGLLALAGGTASTSFNKSDDTYFRLTDRSDSSYSMDMTGGTITSDAANKKLILTLSSSTRRVPAASANGNGIYKINCTSMYLLSSSSGWRSVTMFFIPVKSFSSFGSDITSEAIGTGDGSALDFKTYFTNATNATVYVDGVAASNVTVNNLDTVTNNIHFASPPASGAVITADYHTAVIAKDANHVFDLGPIEIQFGEHTA